MAATMWTPVAESQLIELYKENNCLWNTRDHLYHNKHKRTAALQCIASFFSGVSVQEIKKKWISLTTIFRREMAKVTQSEQSGISTEDQYVPSWLHFHEMQFLHSVHKPRNRIRILSVDTVTNTQQQENDKFQDTTVNYLVDVEDTSNSYASSVESLQMSRLLNCDTSFAVDSPPEVSSQSMICDVNPEQSLRSRKRKSDTSKEALLTEAITVLRHSPAKPMDDVQHFANFMAASLRNMQQEKRNMTIVALGRLLFDAMST